MCCYILDMKNIYRTDMRQVSTFTRCGYKYRKIEQTEKYMLWEMVKKNGKLAGYEVWNPMWYKNPDGNRVWRKPIDESFGTYGWYYTSIEKARTKINSLMNH